MTILSKVVVILKEVCVLLILVVVIIPGQSDLLVLVQRGHSMVVGLLAISRESAPFVE